MDTAQLLEDGEIIGTLPQLAAAYGSAPSTLLRCAESSPEAIVLKQEEIGLPVLILESRAAENIAGCVIGNGASPPVPKETPIDPELLTDIGTLRLF